MYRSHLAEPIRASSSPGRLSNTSNTTSRSSRLVGPDELSKKKELDTLQDGSASVKLSLPGSRHSHAKLTTVNKLGLQDVIAGCEVDPTERIQYKLASVLFISIKEGADATGYKLERC